MFQLRVFFKQHVNINLNCEFSKVTSLQMSGVYCSHNKWNTYITAEDEVSFLF